MFGGAQSKPPTFGGFGATTTSAPSFGGFGGAAQPAQAGGMFGQNKPSFSFGSSAPATQPTFGGFGATSTAGGGIFGGAATQNKPGGLFGGTNTAFGGAGSAFGTGGATGFGGTATGFGGAPSFGGAQPGGGAGFSGFGGGSTFGAAAGGGLFNPAATVQPGMAGQATNAIQQQLVQLSSSPYGDNPIFKNLTDPAKREDILKPVNPMAQKVLESTQQYKVSPQRNVKPKPKPIGGSLANRSAIFDGLEDDDVNPKSQLFVPKASVKKLILKPRSPAPQTPTSREATAKTTIATTLKSANASVSEMNTPPLISNGNMSPTTPDERRPEVAAKDVENAVNRSADESLNLPAVKDLAGGSGGRNDSLVSADESFAALNPQRKLAAVTEGPQTPMASPVAVEDEENRAPQGPVTLRRSGYYTIPPLNELATYVEKSTGACNVENFTVGRTDYGNIFFPGVTDVAGLNLDEIVFIRHKEVIVYPDDTRKPELGRGLNRRAQVSKTEFLKEVNTF